MGRKPKDKVQFSCKVNPQTKEFFDRTSVNLGYIHNLNGKPVAGNGNLLDAIASGEFVILRSDVYAKLTNLNSKDTPSS